MEPRSKKKKRQKEMASGMASGMASDPQQATGRDLTEELIDELLHWSLLRKSVSGDDLAALQSSTTSGVSSGVISPNEPEMSAMSAMSAIMLKGQPASSQTASRPPAPTPLARE